MAANGSVQIQGCAYRISALNADGSCTPGATSMVQDDRPFVKLEAKPVLVEGVDITPISACGIPIISYKDCDRYKRWTINLTLGDFDPEAQELVGQGAIMTGPSSAGRTTAADGTCTVNSNIISSTLWGSTPISASDIGRTITDPGFTVATCISTTVEGITTLTTSVTNGFANVVPGQTVQLAGSLLPAGTTVVSINTTTSIVLTHGTLDTTPPGTNPSASVTATFFYLPYQAIITEVYNPDIDNDLAPTQARIGGLAHGNATASIIFVLGALSAPTIGYNYPHLLLTACPNGVSIEVWSKLIVRGTGFQGTAGTPTAGTPTSPGSAWLRTGIFRCYLWYDGLNIDNKEQQTSFQGWAIENPNFGTGPNDDWRASGLPATGAAVDTTTWAAQLCDIAIPSPLQAGFQSPLV